MMASWQAGVGLVNDSKIRAKCFEKNLFKN